MTLFECSKKIIFPEPKVKFVLVVLILVSLLSTDQLVEITGGTTFSYLHILYIPIILSGLIFSIRGGVVVGFLAGLLMGPLMPTSIEYEITQPFFSWVFRLFIFTLVGALAGAGSSIFKAYVDELELKHRTNPLTDLPNLNGLTHTFKDLIESQEEVLTIIVAELSHIHEIDQTLGAEGVDTLILQLAQDLKEIIGNRGVLGQLQAHTFVILVPEEKIVGPLLKDCETISEQTFYVSDIPIFIELRFGVSRYPLDDHNLNDLTRKALISLSTAKNQIQRISYFDRLSDDFADHNLFMLHKLKKAIESQSLTLEYQPKIHLKTKKLIGFEALVRWYDPVLLSVSPMTFIPLAEETLLIIPLTQWAVETAVKQMHKWQEQRCPPVTVSVNFSTKNFQASSPCEPLTKLLETYKISPHLLEIEVTETSVSTSLSMIAKMLTDLRNRGMRVAIDDFGTGQASQQYLLDFPIDVIKIDKVFTEAITHNPAAAAIVKNAISLAHDLNIEVIAEGVETQEQCDLLTNWGCDAGQGYLFGRSLKEKDATHLIKTHPVLLQEKKSQKRD